jgi:plastocyanin
MKPIVLLVLFSCGCAVTPRDKAVAEAIRRLEARLVQLEMKDTDPARKLPPSPVVQRANSLRSGADYLEKAELARRKGDLGRAAMLFQQAVDEVGADELADVESLFGKRSHAETEAAPAAPAAEADAVPASMTPAPPDPAPAKALSSPRARDKSGSLTGSLRLDGPFAAAGGQGVVLLAPVGGPKPTSHPRHATLEQRKKEFVPHLLTVPTGSTVSFPNADPVFHNVFSLSEAKRFDLGLYKNGDSRDVTFGQHGIIRLLCNLHAAMNAFIVVHDEPYVAVTDRTGRFHFRDLPPGKYKLRAWHERTKDMVERQIEVEPGGSRLVVPMRADLQPVVPPDKEGKPRGQHETPHS